MRRTQPAGGCAGWTGAAPVRLQAVYGDRLLSLAHLQPEHLWTRGEDLLRAAVEWRQGGERVALADIHECRRQQRSRRLGRHLRVGEWS
jgi:hypothetical protein